MDAKLEVGNLSDTTSNDDLRRLFAQAGDVALVSVIKDHATGLSTGQAVIAMGTRADTRKAISMFNAYRLGERNMTVSLARPRLVRGSGRTAPGTQQRPATLSSDVNPILKEFH